MADFEDKENIQDGGSIGNIKNLEIIHEVKEEKVQSAKTNNSIAEQKFEPGSIIKFRGLQGKKEFNGRFGVIKKQLDNGRFKIMIDGQNDLSIKKSNLELVNQCPNEDHLVEEGLLFWPHVKGVNTPCIQWLQDEALQKAFKNPYDKKSPFHNACDENDEATENKTEDDEELQRKMLAAVSGDLDPFRNYDMSWADVEMNFHFQKQKRKQFMEGYEKRLKELLNWTNPTPWIKTITTEGAIENQVCVYYDKDSKGAKNDWLGYRFPSIPSVPREIRGPFVFIGHLHKPRGEENLEIINYHKGLFHISKYYGQPGSDGSHVGQTSKEMLSYQSQMHKIMTKLTLENVCANYAHCENCQWQKTNNQEMADLSESSGRSLHEITSAMDEMYHIQELCEQKGIDVDDFMYHLVKKSAENIEDPNDPIHAHVAKMAAKRSESNNSSDKKDSN